MILTRMDLLNLHYMDKMNNNIGILCYEGDALMGGPRMQPISAYISSHRTAPPPISPSKRKYGREQANDTGDHDLEHMAKMSRLFAAQIDRTMSGQHCQQDPRERSRSPVERCAVPALALHAGLAYVPATCLSAEQPLALTKHGMESGRSVPTSPVPSPVERQQNRPSVITCASASSCSLSHCPVSHSGCTSSYRKPATSDRPCDPVIEEHFRRSLGGSYREPEMANSVSVTGSVDDHFAKALGEAWLQIKARSSVSGHAFDHACDSTPSMVS